MRGDPPAPAALVPVNDAQQPDAGSPDAGPKPERELTRYLFRTGWRAADPGPAGALWRRDAAVVAVPGGIVPGSMEWRGVVDRVAAAERRRPEAVGLSIERELMDVTQLRAANDLVIRDSIPLRAGVDLVSSAWSMLRASATTSRQLRGHIAGNFSKSGDEIAGSVRLGQTERGSYVIPLLMRLPEPEPTLTDGSFVPGLEPERMPGEPRERRVMRTLAEALVAVDRVIVTPEKAPSAADLHRVVSAGGSRELLTALHQIFADQSVGEFSARFDWAGSVPGPADVPSAVVIPSEAARRLEEAANSCGKTGSARAN